MKNIETTIIIQASATEVWGVLTDFDSYSEWNPFVVDIKGLARKGGKIQVTLQMEGSKAQTFKPTLIDVEEGSQLSWLGHLFTSGLFDGHHYFRIEDQGDGSVEFIHGENFSGMLVGLVMAGLKDKPLKGFEAMNAALKHRVETIRTQKLAS